MDKLEAKEETNLPMIEVRREDTQDTLWQSPSAQILWEEERLEGALQCAQEVIGWDQDLAEDLEDIVTEIHKMSTSEAHWSNSKGIKQDPKFTEMQ